MMAPLVGTSALVRSAILAASDPVAHVVNHKAFDIDGWWIWSGNMGNLVLSALILMIVGPWVARKIGTGPESEGNARYVTRNRFAHTIEVICVYLREQAVRPLLHERTDKFMPFLWTLFFYILVNNLLGLVPLLDFQHVLSTDMASQHLAYVGGTLTQNLFVTAGLAFISFLVVNAAGIAALGVGGYLKHLTAGAPKMIWPVMIPVEIVGTFVKPIALAIRLFANMTAGHILLAVLMGFVGFALTEARGVFLPSLIVVLSFGGAVGIMLLELFVAFLQAFVFMFLTTVFISLLAHHDEDHAEGHEHAHAH